MAQSTSKIDHRVWEDPSTSSRGIQIAGWEIETRKKPILNASEIDEAASRLSIPLPEITFGNNLVSLRKTGGQNKGKGREHIPSIIFNGLDALAQVDTTGEDTIKVAYADEWAKSRNTTSSANGEGEYEIETVKNFDWTYSSTYPGTTTEGSMLFKEADVRHPGIPLAKLARQDEPILFYDDVVLFEDELHDNGIANLSVKIRVMPSSFFLLARFFLRVDHVLFRIFDVRLYYDFSSNEVIREVKGKEAPYDRIKQRLPRERPDDLTPLTDSNWVANALGMLENDRPSASIARPVPSVTSATGAPWAAASQARQQIAPGVSIPVRTPLPMPPAPAASPSTGIEAAGESSRKKWKGIGTRLEVAVLD